MRVIKKMVAIMLAAGLVVSSVGISETSNSSTVQAAVHGRKRHKSNKSCPAFRRKMMKALKATNKDTRNLVKAINKYDHIDFKMCYMNKGSWGWRLATSNKNNLIYKVQPSPETAITVHQFAKKNKLNSLQVKGITSLLSGFIAYPYENFDYLYATVQDAKLHKKNGVYYLTATVTIHSKDKMGNLDKTGIGRADLW